MTYRKVKSNLGLLLLNIRKETLLPVRAQLERQRGRRDERCEGAQQAEEREEEHHDGELARHNATNEGGSGLFDEDLGGLSLCPRCFRAIHGVRLMTRDAEVLVLAFDFTSTSMIENRA